ncbi:MAG: iron complex outerrane recepter protein, partial [Gammaproteobacteria bacterium]|nr:iron complex outerrane recepter protein [Gammaproteobacteria bacterium]
MNANALADLINRSPRNLLFILALTIGAGVHAIAAGSDPGDAGNAELAEIVVTGSSIKQINGETALPVQVLKREDIARTGATSVEELFRQ